MATTLIHRHVMLPIDTRVLAIRTAMAVWKTLNNAAIELNIYILPGWSGKKSTKLRDVFLFLTKLTEGGNEICTAARL